MKQKLQNRIHAKDKCIKLNAKVEFAQNNCKNKMQIKQNANKIQTKEIAK